MIRFEYSKYSPDPIAMAFTAKLVLQATVQNSAF